MKIYEEKNVDGDTERIEPKLVLFSGEDISTSDTMEREMKETNKQATLLSYCLESNT